MHNCEEFRERITEHIIDREDLAAMPEVQGELLICSSCSDFYVESREMMDALSAVDLSISESQWWGIERRLRAQIVSEPARRFQAGGQRRARSLRLTPVFAAAALLLITIGLARLAQPVTAIAPTVAPSVLSAVSSIDTMHAGYLDQTEPLDPVTVDFLEESELLLRNVMKIAPNDVEDLDDAKKTASAQLAGINLRKEAAAEVPPVVDVMDTYETILRDLRNIDDRNAAEDIPDLQKRIRKNALIANMKAFQPRVTQVSFGLQ